MRNNRKKKIKSNIQLDLQQSIIKVEELNRVIQEHKKLISPKNNKIKEKLKEQMVVCDIEVQPELPQVELAQIDLPNEDSLFDLPEMN